FVRRYHQALMKYSEPEWYDPVFLRLQPQIAQRDSLLALEFEDAQLNVNALRERARLLRYHLFPLNDVSLVARSAGVQADRQLVTATNHFQLPLEVVGYTGEARNNVQHLDEPVFIPNGRRFTVPPSAEVSLPANAAHVAFRLAGVDSIHFTRIVPWSPPVVDDQLLSIEPSDLTDFPVVHVAGEEAVISSGTHTLTQMLTFPPGMRLIIEPGTTLDMIENAGIVVQGAVHAAGQEDNPVLIRSGDRTASGFTVMSASTSSLLQYVRFDGLNTLRKPGHELTGAVTFYKSDVELRHCAFTNSQSEDALNTFRCEVRIDGLFIGNSAFDGYDADFCTGRIQRTTFEQISNDALDFSGSAMVVEDCTVNGAGDKGISVGEASQIKVIGANLNNCNIGVASKDHSHLEILEVTITNCQQGFTAYQKKPEFGPAEMVVNGYTLDKVRQPYLVERGSTLQLGEHAIKGE
ncbi:MAG: right-handed parallel beta-helix repeat-containing protein, partial [Saprospiraceae bacterium]|nr:right-handed parallel beta-helix repeat-containing protein [Saprospiraceae bacterium]